MVLEQFSSSFTNNLNFLKLKDILHRRRQKSALEIYHDSGRLPLSLGYQEAKHEFIVSKLAEGEDVLFRHRQHLPDGFGILFDERVIEYLWIFSKLSGERSLLLDVGPALNHEFCVEHLSYKRITMLAPTPESKCFYTRGVSYMIADARCLPFVDNYFDEVICLSTLEHIGMDNSKYGGTVEQNLNDYLIALTEIRRVLKRGGVTLITTPYGVSHNFLWFQQFDSEAIGKMLDVFKAANHAVDYFMYNAGWQVSSAEEASAAMYNDVKDKTRVLKESLPVAAHAIACLRLIK